MALPGERTDGHDHLEEARERGACLAVVSRPVPDSSLPQCLVSDTRKALLDLARPVLLAHRKAGHRLVALTGSAGKTTTKELIRVALGESLLPHATRANENNEIGVPLTLLSWPADSEVCVLEAGVRKSGDIDALAPLLESDVGIVTSIGPGHLEYLRTVEEVWAEKSKLLGRVVPKGVRIVPAPVREMFSDDPLFRTGPSRLLVADLDGVSEQRKGYVSGRIVSGPSGLTLELVKSGVSLLLPRPSRALAWCTFLALLAVDALGGDAGEAASRLAKFDGLPGRLQRVRVPGSPLFLLDHYNANPASMEEALSWLGQEISMTGGRGFAVLGDMLELGEESGPYHEKMGEQAAALPLVSLWYKGEQRRAFERGFSRAGGDLSKVRSADTFEADMSAGRGPLPADVLLVKASRGMHLETVILPLTGKGMP